MLKKKQVHSFLKILQIPTDQSAEEIELALKKAGWNPQDAKEAVSMLHPEGNEKSKKEKQSAQKPQLVAQVTKSENGDAPEGAPSQEEALLKPDLVKSDVPPVAEPSPKEPVVDDRKARVPTPSMGAPNDDLSQDQTTPIRVASGSPKHSVPSHPSVQPNGVQEKSGQRPPTTPETKEGTGAAPPAPKNVRAQKVETATPLSFTPEMVAHPDQAANVTVTPKTAQGSAQQLFRSDGHRLSAQTISNLLGIDVEVQPDEFEILKRRRQPTFTFPQLLIIVVCSIALAFAALVYGMYLFEVGPFHPTVEAFSF